LALADPGYIGRTVWLPQAVANENLTKFTLVISRRSINQLKHI